MRTQAVWAGRIFQGVWPPIIFGVGFLRCGSGSSRCATSSPSCCPSPARSSSSCACTTTRSSTAARITGANALVGLAVGLVVGVIAALLAARVRVLDEMLTPLAAAMAAIPIVALTPIFNTMFASTSSTPRRLVVAIYVFFPIFVNTLRGLRQIDPVHAELMRSYAASPWTTTKVVRLPGALPFFFTGLKIASSGAVIAAIVSEYFGGLQKGLGPAITSAAAASAYPRAWAIVTAAIGLGLVFYLAAVLAERLAMPWQRPQGELS